MVIYHSFCHHQWIYKHFYIDLVNNVSNFNFLRSPSPFFLNSQHHVLVFSLELLNFSYCQCSRLPFLSSLLVTRLNSVCFCLVSSGIFTSQSHFFPTVILPNFPFLWELISSLLCPVSQSFTTFNLLWNIFIPRSQHWWTFNSLALWFVHLCKF